MEILATRSPYTHSRTLSPQDDFGPQIAVRSMERPMGPVELVLEMVSGISS